MGIILEGNDEKTKEIKEELLKLSKTTTHRNLGYLLYEISNLPTIEEMKKRFNEIEKRRNDTIKIPGMKTDKPDMDIENIKNKILGIVNDIEKNYKSHISLQKRYLKATSWQPFKDDPKKIMIYIRHLLQKNATEIIANSGGL